MAKDILYRQCSFVCERDGGECTTVAWIPEKKSGTKIEPGVKVTFKDSSDDTQWWTVRSVGDKTMTESRVKEKERLNRRYRETTDI